MRGGFRPGQVAVDPGLLGRCRWEIEQAQLDVEVMVWIARFRFVTAKAVAERFGVSCQQANARMRRLEHLRLVGCQRQHVSQAKAIYLTGRGYELLGLRRRRPPRAGLYREHEEAIVELVIALERGRDEAVVLTERECRQRSGSSNASGPRYCVMAGGAKRWPDVVVERPDGAREAFEIEFAPKATKRLGFIVQAFQFSSYERTTFFVRDAALGRRIRRQSVRSTAVLAPKEIVVAPWIGLPPDAQEHLASTIGDSLAC